VILARDVLFVCGGWERNWKILMGATEKLSRLGLLGGSADFLPSPEGSLEPLLGALNLYNMIKLQSGGSMNSGILELLRSNSQSHLGWKEVMASMKNVPL
jgi:hypothetical protein